MSTQNRKKPTKRRVKKRSFFKTFFRTFFMTIALLIIAGSIAMYALGGKPDEKLLEIAQSIGSNLKVGGDIGNLFSDVKERTNFVILGLDEGGTRTDFMMAGCFNSETKAFDIISMPRDTYVTMPQDRRDILEETGRWAPSELKLCQASHYAGADLAAEFAVKQIEEILDIKIEYYIMLDTAAFRYIVDEIGGVEFDVPQRMYYNDPVQGLNIDLYPGVQALNGEQAEGLIRYRRADETNPISSGYIRGDLDRVEVQQNFMKALISQLISKDNIVKNAPALASAAIKYVKTNFDLTDAGKFIKFIPDINTDNINTYTLPGNSKTINGQSYFLHDAEETAALVNGIFSFATDDDAV